MLDVWKYAACHMEAAGSFIGLWRGMTGEAAWCDGPWQLNGGSIIELSRAIRVSKKFLVGLRDVEHRPVLSSIQKHQRQLGLSKNIS